MRVWELVRNKFGKVGRGYMRKGSVCKRRNWDFIFWIVGRFCVSKGLD